MTSRSSASYGSKGGASGAALRRFPRGERGLSLIELIIASAMLIAVLGAVVPVLVSALKNEPSRSSSVARIGDARALMERLGRELRQAYAVNSASATQLVFRTYSRHSTCGGSGTLPSGATPIQCQVTYNCSAGICTRSEVNADGSGTPNPAQLVTGLESNSVFAYSPSSASPDFVSVTLVMPGRAPGLPAITLSDGFQMRNIAPMS